MDNEFTALIEKCNKQLVTKKDEHLPNFSKFLQKTKDYDYRQMGNPTIDLYFTSRKILIQ